MLLKPANSDLENGFLKKSKMWFKTRAKCTNVAKSSIPRLIYCDFFGEYDRIITHFSI